MSPLSIVNKHGYLQILLALSLSSQAVVLYADDVDNIYQYKNSEGVTEFTDTVKEDKAPVNQIKIPKMTEQEKAQATKKLEQVEQENKELDQQLEAQRQLDKERNIQRQKVQAEKKKNEQQSDETQEIKYYNNGTQLGRPIVRPRPPIRPRPPTVQPRPRPVQLPAR